MANENDYSGANRHVVVPVLHSGSGEVHNVAVPANTPIPEFHDALLDGGYHGEGNVKPPQWMPTPYFDPKVDFQTGKPRVWGPTKEGVVENSPEFKSAAAAVWKAANEGRDSNEAGTYLDGKTERGPISISDQEGHMTLQVPKDAASTIHSHPNHFKGQQAGGQPSQQDIETAKKLGKSVYVVSKSGLQVVEKDGKITSVYSNPDWMSRDNK